jgi:predicted enzyme related to lactoylglutathione lyase
MAVLRPHLALTVTDVERAIPFYAALFGVDPEKVKPGYAKFSVTEPAINFTLTQGERAGLGAFNHAGIQVAATEDVLAAKERLTAAGLAAFDEMETTPTRTSPSLARAGSARAAPDRCLSGRAWPGARPRRASPPSRSSSPGAAPW